MNELKGVLPRAMTLFLIFTVICGFLYTAVVTGTAGLLFPEKANGSITLTIRSVEPVIPACYIDNASIDVAFGQVEPNDNAPVQRMTEEERQKTLEEVNKQQQEFGIQ